MIISQAPCIEIEVTLQATNISHLGRRKILDSKVPAGMGFFGFPGGYLAGLLDYFLFGVMLSAVL